MKTVTFSQLRNNAKKYFDEVEKGETVEVYRHGKPVALISPNRGNSHFENAPMASEPRGSYGTGRDSRLSETPALSGTRELLRDRGHEVIPISYTKRFVREKFGSLETKGSLLKALVKERKLERQREDKKWRRRRQ